MDDDLVKGLVDEGDDDDESIDEEDDESIDEEDDESIDEEDDESIDEEDVESLDDGMKEGSPANPAEEDVEALLAKMESEDLEGSATKSSEASERYRAAELARRFDSMFRDVMEIRMLIEPVMAALAKGGECDEDEAMTQLVESLLELRSKTQADQPRPAKRSKTLDEQWEEIEAGRLARLDDWKKTMEAWRRRTRVGAAAAKHGLTAVNLGPFESARMTLENDRERALKKMHPTNPRTAELDRDTYDDAPFYRTLLKDFVDAKKRPDDDTYAVTAKHALGMPTSKTKAREPVKSKGRRLRFEPHEKLLNFMYPVENVSSKINIEMLLRSLFSDSSPSQAFLVDDEKEGDLLAGETRTKRIATNSLAEDDDGDDDESDEEDDGFQMFG